MFFLICNVIHSFGVNIGPTKVVVSPVGTLPAMGPGHGDLQHYALRITRRLLNHTSTDRQRGFTQRLHEDAKWDDAWEAPPTILVSEQ